MQLFLIRGLPGSGKTTLANSLHNAVVCEADSFFITSTGEYVFNAADLPKAHAACQARARAGLEAGLDVAVANTFTTLNELKPYLLLAGEFGISPTIIVMENDFGSLHNVPPHTIDRMRARWEDYP